LIYGDRVKSQGILHALGWYRKVPMRKNEIGSVMQKGYIWTGINGYGENGLMIDQKTKKKIHSKNLTPFPQTQENLPKPLLPQLSHPLPPP
jgi:hypothetical protein